MYVRRQRAELVMKTRINLTTIILFFRARAFSVSGDTTLTNPFADASNIPPVHNPGRLSTRKESKLRDQWWQILQS